MKNMKRILFYIVFLSLSLQIYAQKGCKMIRKAEHKYENGHNDRALKLLSKAENMNYGFCGNASMDANRTINLLKAKIYINKKEYQMARNSLDSIGWEHIGDNLDSIRIRTYQMEYGKDSLSNMIDSSLVNTKVDCREYECYSIITLTNGIVLKLNVNSINNNLIYLAEEKKKVEIWVTWFKESENYKLIKEKS